MSTTPDPPTPPDVEPAFPPIYAPGTEPTKPASLEAYGAPDAPDPDTTEPEDTGAEIGPDITPAQVVAAATALLAAIVVLFKLDISDARMALIVGAIGTTVPVAWALADAIIRNGRTKVAVARIAANVALATPPEPTQLPAAAPPPLPAPPPAPRTRKAAAAQARTLPPEG